MKLRFEKFDFLFGVRTKQGSFLIFNILSMTLVPTHKTVVDDFLNSNNDKNDLRVLKTILKCKV